MSEEQVGFAKIGAGSFAEILVWQGRGCVVLKVVKDTSRSCELLQEFNFLKTFQRCVSSPDILFAVIAACRYYASFALFKRDMGLLCQGSLVIGVPDVSCLYTMERVWPVPRNLHLLIRDRYFPAEFKDYDKGFLARIYLGKRRRPVSTSNPNPCRFFNPNNWPLDTSSMEDLGLPVARIAMDMGRLLARFHFVAHCDARDIEFVLGGDPLDPFEQFKLYCIDFNQVRAIDPNDKVSFVSTIVESFFLNDPYFPRPDMSYWEEFKAGYLSEVLHIDDDGKAHALAIETLQGIMERAAS